MHKEINFDMDGTLADFYGVNGWLNYLENENVKPYAIAKPLLNFSTLARKLNTLQRNGYKINIISWTSKGGSAEYNTKVAKAKRAWLKKHLKSVEFDNISIIDYGTPKSSCGQGILFDDEKRNRDEWGAGAYDANNIMKVLNKL